MKAMISTLTGLTLCLGTGEALGQNHPPVRSGQIQDIHAFEDRNLNRIAIARLSRIFSDPDGDTLVFSLVDPPAPLNLEIVQEDMLTYRLERDFFTVRPIPVIVKAEDAEFAAYDTFMVQVDPMPDSLGEFHLIAPPDSSVEANQFINFIWTSVVDVDFHRIDYRLHTAICFPDTLYRDFAVGIDTTIEILREAFDQGERDLLWWVTATGGGDLVRSVETFTIFQPLRTDKTPLEPSDFRLYPPYPNPFNSSVTISFSEGIPPSIEAGRGGLSLRIYDLSGRLVADLLSGHPPLTPPASGGGKYSVVWDAGDLGAGVYFVRLEAGGESITRKIILMR